MLKRKKSLLFIFILSTIITLSNTSFASKISLESIVIDFKPQDKKFKDISVFNATKNEKAFVEVEVYEIKNPGTKNEKRVRTNPNVNKETLVVSPQKFIIPPAGKKSLRFISLYKNLEEDKIFRVTVKPVIGDVKSKKGSFLKILVGYDVLVTLRPSKMNPDLQSERNGKTITFTNKGNTNILLRKGTQCSSSDNTNCKDLPGVRLYAGISHTQVLPFNAPVKYEYSIGDSIKTEEFK